MGPGAAFLLAMRSAKIPGKVENPLAISALSVGVTGRMSRLETPPRRMAEFLQ
jgi:hypothetical protein